MNDRWGFENEPETEPRPGAHATGHDAASSAEPFTPIDWEALEGRLPPPRRYAIQDWLPIGCVTSIYGVGGIGKTMLVQQMSTCIATGISAFGFTVAEHGPVLGMFSEDDDDELWRRQWRINQAVGCSVRNLRGLRIQGRAGLENLLVHYPPNGLPAAQPFIEIVSTQAALLRPKLIVLDNIAQMFGGNENDRTHVADFVNRLTRLARQHECAVALVGHPAKADGSEYSGSTQWNNSVRCRLMLSRSEGDDLLRARSKSNYARPDTMPLRWCDGVLRPSRTGDMSPEDAEMAARRDDDAERAFLAALDVLTAQGRNVSHSSRAANYAPRTMAGEFTEKELAAAMDRLFARGAIVANAEVGRTSRRQPVHGIARAPAP